jgi:hypothetical protein
MGKHPYWVGSHRHTHTHINRCMHVYMLTYTQLGLHRLDSLTWKCCMCPLPALHRLIIICMRGDMNGGVHWFEAACSLSTHTAGFQSVRIDVGWSWLKSTCFSRDIFEPFSLEFDRWGSLSLTQVSAMNSRDYVWLLLLIEPWEFLLYLVVFISASTLLGIHIVWVICQKEEEQLI